VVANWTLNAGRKPPSPIFITRAAASCPWSRSCARERCLDACGTILGGTLARRVAPRRDRWVAPLLGDGIEVHTRLRHQLRERLAATE
jgi:hypothetical protein